jgi:hypothetical protein
LPFSAKHEVQQDGNAEDEEAAPQAEDDTGATEEMLLLGYTMLLGYGTALRDDETGGGVEHDDEDEDVVVVQVLMGIGTVSVAPASRMSVEAEQEGCGGFGGM